MKDVASSLHDLVGLFEELGIPYAVMGGFAVRLYGIPRPTFDVDFTAAVERDHLPELYRRITNLGYSIADEYAKGWVDTVAGMPIVKTKLFVEGRNIDIDIFLAESPYQRELLSRRRCAESHGSPVWFVSPEDLVLLKRISYRPRDVADIGDVLFTQGRLDEKYMRKWAAMLGVSARLDEVLATQ